jgi:nitrogen regulatory protein P-II 1
MMHEIKAIFRPDRLETVVHALRKIPDLPGVTVSTVTGYGRLHQDHEREQGGVEFGEVAMTKLEVVVPDVILPEALASIRRAAFTGHPGDGKVFVLPVEQAMKIRSDERGIDAL